MDILELKQMQSRLISENIILTIGSDQSTTLDENAATVLINSFNSLALTLLSENKYQNS